MMMNPYFRLIISLCMTLFYMIMSPVGFAQIPETLPHPKNVILMIGDGMGYNHIQATDYYDGKKSQSYENFPVCLAMAHYPVKAGEYEEGNPASNYYATGYNTVSAWSDTAYLKSNFTESAAAATAMSTGFKTYNNAIGMSVNQDTLENLVELAKFLGKSAGVVTSVEFSHATPAGFVAHNKVRTNYREIAYQMLLNSQCDVIMGCGDPAYDDNGTSMKIKWKDARYVGDSTFWTQLQKGSGKETHFTVGSRTTSTRDCDGDGIPDPWTLIRDVQDFRSLMKGPAPKRVLGCPRTYSTLQQSRKKSPEENKDSPPYTTPFVSTVPTLAEMTGGALNVLSKNSRGFFVMIEGGAVDWSCHSNQKGRLIEEMRSFNETVDSVIQWVNTNSNWKETLLIVTGDHETGLLWGDEPFKPIGDAGFHKLPEMKFYSNNHTNSLIAVFAKGAGSEWLTRMADEYDSKRGPFIQNSEIPQLVHFLWAK